MVQSTTVKIKRMNGLAPQLPGFHIDHNPPSLLLSQFAVSQLVLKRDLPFVFDMNVVSMAISESHQFPPALLVCDA